jgi:hypothetical protein
MTGEPDLIRLLHNADWTRLSMLAEVSDGSTLLVAPGRRYRERTGDYLEGCDGNRPWRLTADTAGGTVHWVSGPEPPQRTLLCPAWLLTSSRLDAGEHVRACGRDALRVVATPRPGIRATRGPPRPAGRIEAVVDAELGILLRVAWLADGEPPDVTELVSLEFDPVIDPAQFTPPPGSLIGESPGEAFGAGGPVWWAIKTAAGLAAGGLGAWIRYSPAGRSQPAAGAGDAEAAMPSGDPAPELSPDGLPAGPPVGDEVLQLLYESGIGEFAATLHQWHDLGTMVAQIPAGARRTGFGGLGLLADAVGERPFADHLVSTLRIGGPGRYQIDGDYQPHHGPVTIACDGHRRWQVYRDRVTVGSAEPPPGDIADLADASWLLGCRLSGGAPVTAGGRPGYRISVTRGDTPWSLALMFPSAVAVVDAELGILLSLTSYLGGKPVWRYELRDVTHGAGDFRVAIPAGLPIIEEAGPSAHRPPHPASIPVKVAGAVAQQAVREATKAAGQATRAAGQAAKAAGEAAKAARDLLRDRDPR